jgi:hypothetical protein
MQAELHQSGTQMKGALGRAGRAGPSPRGQSVHLGDLVWVTSLPHTPHDARCINFYAKPWLLHKP